MKWTVEANNQIGAFPYFVRFTARKLIEEKNRENNKFLVEIEDVLKIKENESIKNLLNIDYELNNIEYKQNLSMNICGGIRGCKRTFFDDMEIAKLFYRVLEESNILRTIEETRGTRRNSSIKAAISGCPNSCSRPQVQDLSIVGYNKPKLTDQECIKCGKCEKECVLDLITVNENININMDECIGCGKCISACPTGSIDKGEEGYRILVGGRLGKDPSLARIYGEFTNLKDLENGLEEVLEKFKKCLENGVRFSDIL